MSEVDPFANLPADNGEPTGNSVPGDLSSLSNTHVDDDPTKVFVQLVDGVKGSVELPPAALLMIKCGDQTNIRPARWDRHTRINDQTQ